jgi:hypothetical protein
MNIGMEPWNALPILIAEPEPPLPVTPTPTATNLKASSAGMGSNPSRSRCSRLGKVTRQREGALPARFAPSAGPVEQFGVVEGGHPPVGERGVLGGRFGADAEHPHAGLPGGEEARP